MTKRVRKAYFQAYQAKNKEELRHYNREYYARRRAQIIEQLGGQCAQCGTTDIQVLCICPNTPIGHRTTPLAEVRRNLAGFHLLCANCRRKK